MRFRLRGVHADRATDDDGIAPARAKPVPRGRLWRRHGVSLLLVLGACAVGPAAILHFFGGREVEIESSVHFLPIAVSAGLASLAAR